MTIVIPSLFFVVKSKEIFFQSFVPGEAASDTASGLPSPASTTKTTGGLALFNFSVRTKYSR